MKVLVALAVLLAVSPAIAQAPGHEAAPLARPLAPPLATPAQRAERLGTVSFPVSCAASSQAAFDRGVALLHDFWYEEARAQFERLVASDPGCAMAHWGVAMSGFHEIWEHPDPATMKAGWAEMQAAEAAPAKTGRERLYIAALAEFFRPGEARYPARIQAYSAAMGKLYAQYPEDADAGAFYALSLLAAGSPNDTTQTANHKAMAVLTPLFAKDPDDPGVDHYIIHACDNPAMAAKGLAAANHYGEIAQSGPHAFHMPGHIYARLGLWPQDIAAQEGSIKAAEEAQARGESGILDEPHSYDFLIYAELQRGEDGRAKQSLAAGREALRRIDAMPGMGSGFMAGMTPYYDAKLSGFYDLETRDWKAAAALEPDPGSTPGVAELVQWVRVLADGRLHDARKARADLARYDKLVAKERKVNPEDDGNSIAGRIGRGEMVAWTDYAAGKQQEALQAMTAAADLQDKVGQGEVDIPAREMLGDMLLDDNRPHEALAAYAVALTLSPNRLNGLFNAGRAAEAAGEPAKAAGYYAALLKTTDGNGPGVRPELEHARSYVATHEEQSGAAAGSL